jgi:hypothetical protein
MREKNDMGIAFKVEPAGAGWLPPMRKAGGVAARLAGGGSEAGER